MAIIGFLNSNENIIMTDKLIKMRKQLILRMLREDDEMYDKALSNHELSLIASSPKWAYNYARNVIKDRFPQGEVVIAKDALQSGIHSQFISGLN